jgi:hypothetical protein
MNDHKIIITLTNGDEVEYAIPHIPLEKQEDSTLYFTWERERFSQYSELSVNWNNVAMVQLVGPIENLDEHLKKLIKQAKDKNLTVWPK